MKIQTKATGILERTSHYLKSGVLQEKPVWFDIVGANPPNPDLTKKPKKFDNNAQNSDPQNTLFTKNSQSGYYRTRSTKHQRTKQNNSISRVPKLTFLEDKLRDVFYHQHPWEFSRPKTLIENSGDEWTNCDWSRMLQFNKPLDGESVVQRTLWLLNNFKGEKADKGISSNSKNLMFEAYDQARFEFYRLRMEEEMSSTVSREESSMFGAIYLSTNMEWGIKQEQEHLDVWANIASENTKAKEANRGGKLAANGSAGSEDVISNESSIWETAFDENSIADAQS